MKKKLTVTNIIIIICIIVYFVDRFFLAVPLDPDEFESITIKILGKNITEISWLVKILGMSFGKLYYFMALPPSIVEKMKIWQPITHMFMHQFIFHLIVNMIALYIVGNKVEKEKGIIYTVLVFILTGIIGVFITNALVVQEAYTAGSSIPVFGLIGVSLGMIINKEISIKDFKKSSIIYMIIYGIIFTYLSGTWTIVAHNIGLILGLVIYFIYYYLIEKKK